MSIYASFCCLDGDTVDYPAPLVYRGSHYLPSGRDQRGGSLDLGSIPAWITRNGYCLAGKIGAGCGQGLCCEGDAGSDHWPFLRVSVRPAQRPDLAAYRRLTDLANRLAPTDVETARAVRAAANCEDTVILDRAQAQRLHDELGWWLATVKEPEGAARAC